MAIFRRKFAGALASGGLTLLLLPCAQAQGFAGARRGLAQPAQQTDAPPSPPPAQPAAASPQPQTAPPATLLPPSMLQQPAREATIQFADNSLVIHADNSSLLSILHQFAARSGMRLDGLNGDERVFGSFGPGAPRDVLADLLNGTAYNVVMVGDLSNGAPRELILSSTTRGGGAPTPSATPQSNADDSSNDQESVDNSSTSSEFPTITPAPPETAAPPPGVKTPQQLFEQLQRMRQGQQQQQPGDQQQQQQQPQSQPQQ
jgi:hypothetical protein